jgi:hypothetical protein
MNSKYDDEIREAESRLMRDRQALVAQAEDLSATARDAASSPKGLGVAFAVGFILGELTAPRRPRKSHAAQTVDTTKKVGLGGLLGSALFAYVRSQYGSPWAIGRSALSYYAETQRARRAAMQRQGPDFSDAASPTSTVAPAAATHPTSAAVAPSAAYPSSVRSEQSHATG